MCCPFTDYNQIFSDVSNDNNRTLSYVSNDNNRTLSDVSNDNQRHLHKVIDTTCCKSKFTICVIHMPIGIATRSKTVVVKIL